MRWVLLLLLVPLVAGHPDHLGGQALQHITLETVTVEPGETLTYPLDFQGQPFTGGWHWLLRADLDGPLRFDLSAGAVSVGSWDWSAGQQIGIATIPFNTTLNLQVHNPGNAPVTTSFYYDQTCKCLYKLVPMESGPVWLDLPANATQNVWFNLTFFTSPLSSGADEPRHVDVAVKHVEMTDRGLGVRESWSRSFEVGKAPCHGGAKWSGCMELEFTAERDGEQLLWLEIEHDGGPGWGIGVRPLADARDADNEAPGLALPLALLGLLVAYRRAR